MLNFLSFYNISFEDVAYATHIGRKVNGTIMLYMQYLLTCTCDVHIVWGPSQA